MDDVQAVDPRVFGRRLRYLRRRRGLSLTELAQKVGKQVSYLSMIENSKREPRLSTVIDLASALEMPIAELLSEELPTTRDRLEVELLQSIERPMPGIAPLPPVHVSQIKDDLLEHLVALHRQLKAALSVRAATPE